MDSPQGPLTPAQLQAFTLDTLVKLTNKVDRIEGAIIGDEKFNTKGLMHDVKKLQKENSRSKKFQWTTGTTLTGFLFKWFYHIFEQV